MGHPVVGIHDGNAELNHRQAQGLIVYIRQQGGERFIVDPGRVDATLVESREQVFAKLMNDAVQGLPLHPQAPRRVMGVEGGELRLADLAVGEHRQGHDARCGLRAVARVGSHGFFPWAQAGFSHPTR
jgi:hypothetical protein